MKVLIMSSNALRTMVGMVGSALVTSFLGGSDGGEGSDGGVWVVTGSGDVLVVVEVGFSSTLVLTE